MPLITPDDPRYNAGTTGGRLAALLMGRKPKPLPEPEQPGFVDVFSAAGRTQNVFGSLAANIFPRISAGLSPFRGDGNDPFNTSWDSARYLSDPDFYHRNPWAVQGFDQLRGARSEDEFFLELETLRQSHEDFKTLAQSGIGTNLIASLGVNLADPTNFIPFGALTKVQKGAKAIKLLRNIGQSAVVAAVSNTVQEEMLHAIQPGRPVGRIESDLMAAGMGLVLGGTLGALSSPNYKPALRQINQWIPLEKIRKATDDMNRSFNDPFDELSPRAEKLKSQAIEANVPEYLAHENAVLEDNFRGTLSDEYGVSKEFLDSMETPDVRRMSGDGLDDVQATYHKSRHGMIHFMRNGKSVIELVEEADPDTLGHELGHYFLETYGRAAEHADATPKLKQDWAVLREFLEIESISKITREGHEKFANGLGEALRNGKVAQANGKIKKAVQVFKNWFRKIFNRQRDQLPPHIQDLYDTMLNGKSSLNKPILRDFTPKLQQDNELLESLLLKEPEDNMVVSVLHRNADDAKNVAPDQNATLLRDLQEHYARNDKKLEIARHPLQEEYDTFTSVEQTLNDQAVLLRQYIKSVGDDGAAKASFDEMADTLVDKYTQIPVTLASKLLTMFTPTKVFDESILGLTQQIRRLMFYDGTVSKNAMLKPDYKGVVSAEAHKAGLERQLLATTQSLRNQYNPSRQLGAILGRNAGDDVEIQTAQKIKAFLDRKPMSYTDAQGQTQTVPARLHYGKYQEAVLDILRQRKAHVDGFIDELPSNIDPRLEEGVKAIQDYAGAMLDRADEVGLLPGKRTLEKVGKEFDEVQNEVDALSKEQDQLFAESPQLREDPQINLATNLSPESTKVQQELFNLTQDTAKADEIYSKIRVVDEKGNVVADTFGGKVIGTDLARFLHDGYRTYQGRIDHTKATSRPASAYAEDLLRRRLSDPPKMPNGEKPVVIFNAGGVASGKSRSLSPQVVEIAQLISDGQMKNPAKAIKEIELAIEKGWDVRVFYTQRPFDLVVSGAIQRAADEGRWGSVRELPEIHMQAQKSFAQVADHFKGQEGVEILPTLNAGTQANPVPMKDIQISDIAENGRLRYNDIVGLERIVENELENARKSGQFDSELLSRLGEPPRSKQASSEASTRSNQQADRRSLQQSTSRRSNQNDDGRPDLSQPQIQVKTIYTSIPEEWHNKTLFDWGSKGLRVEGNQAIGRAKSFSPLWLDQVKRIKRGENPAVIRELRQMTGEIWEVRKKTGKFWNTDHYLASPDAIAEAQARVNTRKLTRIEKQLNAAEARLEAKRDRLIEVQEFIANSEFYSPRRYLTQNIKEDKTGFTSLLKRSWQKARNLVTDPETGKRIRIDDDNRMLIDSIRDRFEIDESVRTEGDLKTKSLEDYFRYQRLVDDYAQKSADQTWTDITNPENAHGVDNAFAAGSSLMKRRLTLDESDPAARKFLDSSAESLLSAYHHTVGGRIAGHIAVKRGKYLLPKAAQDIESPDQLVKYLDDQFQTASEIAHKLDQAIGSELAPPIDANRTKVMNHMKRRVGNLMGNGLVDNTEGANAMLQWAGQQVMSVNYLSMLGSQSLAATNDVAALTLFADITSVPRNVKYMVKSIAPLKKATMKELKLMRLGLESEQSRALAVFDVDFSNTHLGVGHGTTRKVTAGISTATSKANDIFNEASLIAPWNRYIKRVAGLIALDRTINNTKKMIKANAMIKSGIPQGEALRKVGISKFDYGQIKELGINEKNGQQLLSLIREYGTDENGKPLSNLSPEELLEYKGVSLPNAQAWLNDLGDEVRPLYETYVNAVNTQVEHGMVVTPSLSDKPLMNDHWFGRAFNQFQTFGWAWANQVARPAAQRSGSKITSTIGAYFAIGAIVDATRNHLAGRRDFDETMQLWTENPLAMTYVVSHTSGVTGWFNRPMAMLDKWGIGPGTATAATTSRAAYQAGSPFSAWSPTADTFERLYGAIPKLVHNRDDPRTWHMLRKSVPGQNLLGFRMSNRFLGVDPLLTERMMKNMRKSKGYYDEPRP